MGHSNKRHPPNITRLHDTKHLDRFVMLDGIHFPEFSPTTKVAKLIKASVFDNNHLYYDVIIGMDVMQPLGSRIDCSTLTISWNENTIPFRPANYFDNKQLFLSISALLDDEDSLDNTGYRTKSILFSKYKEVDVANAASQQKHLSQRQQQDLAAVLKQHTKLFSGKLSLYVGCKVYLELEPGAKPISSHPYSLPKMHQALFKEELDCRPRKRGSPFLDWSQRMAVAYIYCSQERWQIFEHSTKCSNVKCTIFQGFRIFFLIVLVTSISPRLTSQCSTTHSNLRSPAKNCAPSALPSVITNAIASPWELSNRPTWNKKSWKISFMV
jgi:hypothetical protein